MTDTTDFSKHPRSITEIRSDRSGKADDWTVRDVLINALRDLDSGEIDPDYCLVIVGSIDESGATETSHYQKTPNRYILRGLVEDFKDQLILRDAGD